MQTQKTLAVKYRPKTFEDVVEQNVIKAALQDQIDTGTIKNCYLFCGASGTGKTTDARIFAQKLNGGNENIVELDAASNSGVENFKSLLETSRLKPIGTPFRIFIVDECHALSNASWQSALLSMEEPVPTSIFIYCTTDPQKIPATITGGRVQRFDFQRISHGGIVNRLKYIIDCENKEGHDYTYEEDGIDYIAKLANGGMRNAIAKMEHVLSYSHNITVENVSIALGTVDYVCMFDLTDALCKMDKKAVIEIIETVHRDGKDLKQFIKDYCTFVLDLCKYDIMKSFEYLQIPSTYSKRVSVYKKDDFAFFTSLLNEVLNLNSNIKWEPMPKPLVESTFILLCSEA